MSAKDENLLVKFVKKAVGLPTADSCRCSVPVSSGAEDCCGGGGCGCNAAEATSADCCLAENETEKTQPASQRVPASR